MYRYTTINSKNLQIACYIYKEDEQWLVLLGWFIDSSHCGRVDKEDEMTCLIKGCNFVLKNIPHEAFVYAKHADSEFRFQTTQPDIFPYLLVNIGSGVSIVKVITDKFKMFISTLGKKVTVLKTWRRGKTIG